MDDIERQRRHFDGISERYIRARKTDNHLLVKSMIWREFLRGKEFLARRGAKVLEPMCGFCEGKGILEANLGVEIDYEGFDYSSEMVNYSRELNPGINVSVVDVTQFHETDKYDIIIIIGGLHHVPAHAKAVLEAMFVALKAGGHIILFEPTHDNWLFRRIREEIYKRNSLFDSETERAFNYIDFLSMVTDSGFSIIDRLHAGLSAYVFFYNPDAFPGLNLKSRRSAKLLFAFDRLFMRNPLGRKLSFATLLLACKPLSGD
jgi:SAM-dependent methyltransferase